MMYVAKWSLDSGRGCWNNVKAKGFNPFPNRVPTRIKRGRVTTRKCKMKAKRRKMLGHLRGARK